MSNAPKMKETKEILEKEGFEVLTTSDLDYLIENPNMVDDLDADYEHCVKNDIFRRFFDSIAESDAVLALNYPKHGIDGYCGVSVCMELGLAYYLRKKIYLLNPLPSWHDQRWAMEIAVMQPEVINGDITKLKILLA